MDKEGQTTNNLRQRILRIKGVKGLDQYQQHGAVIVDDEGALSVLRDTLANVYCLKTLPQTMCVTKCTNLVTHCASACCYTVANV